MTEVTGLRQPSSVKKLSIPNKDPMELYRFSTAEYSQLSKMINNTGTFPSICEFPSVGTNTKYGRIATMGLTLSSEYYKKKTKCIKIMREPYYLTGGDIEYDLSSFRKISSADYDAIYDLLSTGVAVLPQGLSTFLLVVMFFRLQKFMSHEYDLLLRGNWPYYEGNDDIIVYIDQDYAV